MKILTITLSIICLLTSFNCFSGTIEQQFGSWRLICGEKNNCSLTQVVSTDKSHKNIALGFNVNYSISTEFPVLMLRLPPNIRRSSGVGLKIGDFKPVQIKLSDCNKTACQSVIKMDKKLLSELSSSKFAFVAVALKDKIQFTIPVDLNGFNDGFKALNSAKAS